MTITLATLALALALAPADAPAHKCDHSAASGHSGHADHASHAGHDAPMDHCTHAGHAAPMDHAGHAGHATPMNHSNQPNHSDHSNHSNHSDHAAPEQPAANSSVPGGHVRWTPDAPLIQGMASVREAVATLAHHEMGHMGEPHVIALAGEIDTAIASMFANCKLEPEPDIALHGLLARLMAGTQALHAKPANASPVADMRDAVQDYGKLFDDPGITAKAGEDDGDL